MWSVEKELRRGLIFITLVATILTSVIVAIHYGRDVEDLRQRKVLDQVESIVLKLENIEYSHESPATSLPSFSNAFERHPLQHGWRILGPEGTTLSTSSFDWSAQSGIPISAADEWVHSISEGIWIAGKRFNCGQAECQVQVISVDDPAGHLLRLILSEAAVHILIPIVPFALLILFGSRRLFKRTFEPLSDIATKARQISEFRDVEPIPFTNAPDEVRDLIDALNSSLARLNAAMERERAFIFDASHTLRTPLAALKARLEILTDRLEADVLQRDVDALIRLCSQMLTSAHAGRIMIDPGQRVDLESIIFAVIERLEPLAKESGISIAYERISNKTLTEGDPDALHIALVNLLENAVQHSPPGTEIVVKLENQPLHISITDQGPGIPEDQISIVTERFGRVGPKAAQGAGLGLSITQQIMQAHQGELRLEISPQGGLSASLVFLQDN